MRFRPGILAKFVLLIAIPTILFMPAALFAQKVNAKNTGHINIAEKTDELLAGRRCPCQCNHYLPGGNKEPACFGCSAAKAEIAYVMESLEAGRDPRKIIVDIVSPIIIDVFSDYTNPNIAKVWKLAKKVSKELGQTRVVMRPPCLTNDAVFAAQLVECARLNGKFGAFQDALINHRGPWDKDTLFEIAAGHGMKKSLLKPLFNKIDLKMQISKDRQHARERNIKAFPKITVNRLKVDATEDVLNAAVKKILLEGSI